MSRSTKEKDTFYAAGEEADQIAEAHREEVIGAVKNFFKETYKTDVKVHNIVGNVDGATVFVESTGPVHFYTTAIIPIDLSKEGIMVNQVFTMDSEVESAIRGGLYHLIFEEKFNELDRYLDRVVAENKVVGKTIESIENVGGTGYMTPYYFLTTSSSDKAIKPVYDAYMKNPNAPVSELKEQFAQEAFSVEYLKINHMLFMEEMNVEPDDRLFHQIAQDLKGMTMIPKGSYSLTINDNLINKKVDDGYKDNSLRIGVPDYIVVE
ncbi:DUF1672 family protein [Rossellomorea sp. FM04394]|uniref:DUF1672 family protein n=1 Tax=Rossellomorea sp. FM04394 TaxID=3243076 RepID=UPI0035A61EAE